MLKGQVALVTGASRGIGRAIALDLGREGATVIGTATSEAGAAEIQKVLDAAQVQGWGAVLNVTDAASCDAVMREIEKRFGAVSVLVNNAGITRDNLILRMTEQQWDEIMHTNLKSVFNICKQVVKPMMKQRGGSIINMSSIVGMTGNAGQTNYSASKAGIIGFTKSLAKELGSRNIRCNAIAPGFIETEMTHGLSDELKQQFMKNIPLGRYGSSEEVAKVCVFLASELSSYVNGQVISVCGGLNT